MHLYHIDQHFLPEIKQIRKGEGIVVTSYYGVQSEDWTGQIIDRYQNIIFDHSQSFFRSPMLQEGVYNVYSPRKFFGVTDGAYLVSKHFFLRDNYERDLSSERSEYLFSSTERGTNAVYGEYLKAEEKLSESGIRRMSQLTHIMLCNVNYEKVRETRRNNFKTLNQLLGGVNELVIEKMMDVPMCYPLFIRHDELRMRLVTQHIYVPQWWKWVILSHKANTVEESLSEYLFPLPVDQRYDKEDMMEIGRIVKASL